MLGAAEGEASSSPLSPPFPTTSKIQHRSHVKRESSTSLLSSGLAASTGPGKKTTKVKDAPLPYSKRAGLMRSGRQDMGEESDEDEELEHPSTRWSARTDQPAKSAVTRATAAIATRRMKKMAERG